MKESDLPGVIAKRLEELGRNKNWLATESGIARAQFYDFMKGDSRLKWPTLEKVFAILGLSLSIEVGPKEGKALRRAIPKPPNMPV